MNNIASGNEEIHFQMMAPWKKAIVSIFFLIILVFVAYGEVFLSMIATWWRSGTFTHGFLIAPISIYLIWRSRNNLLNLNQRIEVVALAGLFGMVFLWLAAHIANILVVQQLAVVSMVILTVFLMLGRYVAYAILFPLLYLYFMVPFGEFLIPKLQDITAYIAVSALQLTGIPVFWEGFYFSIPSGSFKVAEACSGVRYLIASLALGTLYAYLMYASMLKRLVFIVLSVVVPIIANGLRVYSIVLLADMSGYKLAIGVDHLIYGWIFFGLIMAILFWLGSRFRGPVDQSFSSPLRDTALKIAVAESPGERVRWFGLVVLAASMVIVSGPFAASYLDENSREYQVEATLPEHLNGLARGPSVLNPEWAPHFEGADDDVSAVYQGEGGEVELYVAYYTRQEQGEELIKINNRYLPDGWNRVTEKINGYRLEDGSAHSLRLLHARQGDRKVTLFQEYYIDGRYTSSAAIAKIYEIISSLSGRNRISAIIMFSVDEDYLGDDPDGRVGKILSALHRDLVFSIDAG